MHSEVQGEGKGAGCFLSGHVFFVFFGILSLFPFVALLLIGPPEDSFVYVGKMDDQR